MFYRTNSFVKNIYKQLPNHLNKIFEARPPLRVKDSNEINLSVLLTETFTAITIQSEKKAPDGTVISVSFTSFSCLRGCGGSCSILTLS